MILKFITQILFEQLEKDAVYKEYIETYKKETNINLDLARILLIKYETLYKIFIKTNLFLYKYDSKELDDELRDYRYIDGELLYVDDIDFIMYYYINNYDRCKKIIKCIIDYKLRPTNELNILTQIYERDLSEEKSNLMKRSTLLLNLY